MFLAEVINCVRPIRHIRQNIAILSCRVEHYCDWMQSSNVMHSSLGIHKDSAETLRCWNYSMPDSYPTTYNNVSCPVTLFTSSTLPMMLSTVKDPGATCMQHDSCFSCNQGWVK